MATFYALPSLTQWSQVGGWSSTSGGPSNGVASPSSTADVVIFDANSGPARTITSTGITCASMTCTGAAMTINAAGNTIYIYGNNLDFSGFAAILGSMALNGSGTSIKGGNCQLGQVTVYDGSTVNMTGDLSMTGNLSLCNGGLRTNGYNLTVAQINDNSSSVVGSSVIFNGGIITFTATGAIPCMAFNYLTWSISGSTTFKISSAGLAGFTQTGTYSNLTLWAAAGLCQLSGSLTLAKVRIDGGATLRLNTGYTVTAPTWQVAGTPTAHASLNNNGAGTTSYIACTGTNYLDYCNIQNMNGTSSSFIARSSTDQGGNSNITFLKFLPNFLSFF